jgi:hypothetical protein
MNDAHKSAQAFFQWAGLARQWGAPLYRVAWCSRLTGAEGIGVARLPLHAAEELVDECNRLYPDIIHWAVRENPNEH